MDLARLWPLSRAASIALIAPLVLVAAVSAGCGKSGEQELQASVNADITQGNIPGACNFGNTTPLEPSMGNGTLGAMVNNDQTVDGGGSAIISCRVTPNSDGTYSFAANATLSSDDWSFTISSNSDISPATQPATVTVEMAYKGEYGLASAPLAYSSNSCALTWPAQGFIPGGIQGSIVCNQMQQSGDSNVTLADGGVIPITCGGTASFVFEGCSQ